MHRPLLLGPDSPVHRAYADVRASVDARLGAGGGLGLDETWARLDGPERVAWMLGELAIALLERGFHRWIQAFAQGEADWPGRLRAVLTAAAPLAPATLAPLRWAVERGASVRALERGEALVSVVPEVCLAAWEPLVACIERLVEVWPADVDPCALPPVAPWTREVVPPAAEGPRYPAARVGYTDRAQGCDLAASTTDEVSEVTCLAAWRAGASDEELDALFGALAHAGERLPEVCAAWVAFDGDGGDPARFEAHRARLFPRHPLEARLGDERLASPSLVLLDEAGWPAVGEALRACRFAVLSADGDRDALAHELRSALRGDPDGIALHAARHTAAVDEILVQALLTGHIIAVFGASPALEALADRIARDLQVPVRRERGGPTST